MPQLFLSYSHADEALKDELWEHLANVRREGNHIWQDRELIVGDELDPSIKVQLESADIILLLISHKFLASYYCFEVEFAAAIARHNAGTARLIPIILDHCDWTSTEIPRLLATPKDGKPVADWPNPNAAFLDVVKQIRRAIAASKGGDVAGMIPGADPAIDAHYAPRKPGGPFIPTITTKPTDLDFRRAATTEFEKIRDYFKSGIRELATSAQGIDAECVKITETRFVASLFINGNLANEIAIWVGGLSRGSKELSYYVGKGISHTSENTFSGSIALENENGRFVAKLNAWSSLLQGQGDKIEGIEDSLWRMFIAPLT